MKPLFTVFRALVATSGREALKQSLSAYSGLGLVSVVLFAGNGLDARRVVAECHAQPGFGVALFLAWALFSLPATRTVLTHPKTLFLRSLPLSPHALLGSLGSLLALVHLPWFLLWFRGQGLAAALCTTSLCLLLDLTLVTGIARYAATLRAAAGLLLWLSPLPQSWVSLLLVAGVVLSVRDAWLLASQRGQTAWQLRLPGPGLVQLSAAYVRICLRSEAARVSRAGIYFTCAGVLSWLAQSNLPPGESTLFPEVSLSISALLAAATLLPPLLRTEQAAGWVLAVTFTPRWLRRASILVPCLLCALCFTLVFSSLAHASIDQRVASGGGWAHELSIALCTCVVSVAGLRFAIPRQPKDANRIPLAVLALAGVAVVSLTLWLPLFSNLIPCGMAVFTLLDGRGGKGMTLFKSRARVPTIGAPVLRADAVHKRLGARRLLTGVSFECATGESVGIVGANGAGKTTLLQLLSGQLEPDSGAVYISGLTLSGGAPEPRTHLGYVPDTSDALGDLCAREFVDLVRALKGGKPTPKDAAFEQALAFSILAPRPMRELSLGQRKRVCLLAALYGDPQVLILDEPSNGLDPDAVTWLVQLFHERRAAGQVTVFSTNDRAFLDRTGASVLRLADGQLHAPITA